MKKTSTGRAREGVRGWIFAATIGLTTAAALAILVRATGLGAGRADDDGPIDGRPKLESLAVADDDASDAPIPPVKSHSVLMSISTAPAPTREIVVAPSEIDRAKRAIAACLDRYREINDYSCVFHKRERIDGKLIKPHIMAMKVRTRPESIYFKFAQPNRGREAIYAKGKNNGKIIAHDIGLGKLLAGTMILDPKGSMAMDESRHPISEAGIGALIQTIRDRWDSELDPSEAKVSIHPHAKVVDRPCTMIETTHPTRAPGFLFHKVKLFIDHDLGLPIRFEAYDWPKAEGAEPELVEEYTYADLKTDVGLSDVDFDPANPRYSFGRF